MESPRQLCHVSGGLFLQYVGYYHHLSDREAIPHCIWLWSSSFRQVRRSHPELAEQTASAGGQLVGGSLPIGGGRGGRREEHGGQVRHLASNSSHQDYIRRPCAAGDL